MANELRNNERIAEAKRLRNEGLSYVVIADRLGYSNGAAARRAVKSRDFQCLNCNATFLPNSNFQAFCSRECKALYQTKRHDNLEQKRCSKCKEWKPVTAFGKNAASRGGRRPDCRTCTKEMRASYYERNKERLDEEHRAYYFANRDQLLQKTRDRYQNNLERHRKYGRDALLRQYGLTEVDYEQLWLTQGGRCAICWQPERVVDKRTGDVRRLSIDHDHDTGAVRGLLCRNCNVALGLFGDGTLLDAARIYVGGGSN